MKTIIRIATLISLSMSSITLPNQPKTKPTHNIEKKKSDGDVWTVFLLTFDSKQAIEGRTRVINTEQLPHYGPNCIIIKPQE